MGEEGRSRRQEACGIHVTLGLSPEEESGDGVADAAEEVEGVEVEDEWKSNLRRAVDSISSRTWHSGRQVEFENPTNQRN